MNIAQNSIIDKALTENGFVRTEDFKGEFYTLDKKMENEDFVKITLIPDDFEDGFSTITTEWKSENNEDSEIFVNDNPITVLSEAFEHFDESGASDEIRAILYETVKAISSYSCN